MKHVRQKRLRTWAAVRPRTCQQRLVLMLSSASSFGFCLVQQGRGEKKPLLLKKKADSMPIVLLVSNDLFHEEEKWGKNVGCLTDQGKNVNLLVSY